MGYITKKAVSDKAHKHGFMVSSAAYKAIDDMVEKMIVDASKRAKANKRKTIMPHDF